MTKKQVRMLMQKQGLFFNRADVATVGKVRVQLGHKFFRLQREVEGKFNTVLYAPYASLEVQDGRKALMLGPFGVHGEPTARLRWIDLDSLACHAVSRKK